MFVLPQNTQKKCMSAGLHLDLMCSQSLQHSPRPPRWIRAGSRKWAKEGIERWDRREGGRKDGRINVTFLLTAHI